MRRTIHDVRRRLDKVFASGLEARRGLKYVIEHAAEFDHGLRDYPKWWVADPERKAQPDSLDHELREIQGELHAAVLALEACRYTEAHLAVCEAICTWHKRARQAYDARLKLAESAEVKRKRDRMTYVRGWARDLSGAKSTAKRLADEGLCLPEDATTFCDLADKFRVSVDERYPMKGIQSIPNNQLRTALSRHLVWAFVRVGAFSAADTPGLSGAEAADFAQIVAKEHGLTIKMESMRVYAGELLRG